MLLRPNGALLGETDEATQHYSDKLLHHNTAALSEVRASRYHVPEVTAGSASGACIAEELPTRLGAKNSLGVCVTRARRGQ